MVSIHKLIHPTELFTGVGDRCLYTGLDNSSKVTSENYEKWLDHKFDIVLWRWCQVLLCGCLLVSWRVQLHAKVCSSRWQKWAEVWAHSEYVACCTSELKYATFPLLSRFLVPCLALWIIRHFPTPGKIGLFISICTLFILHVYAVSAFYLCSIFILFVDYFPHLISLIRS